MSSSDTIADTNAMTLGLCCFSLIGIITVTATTTFRNEADRKVWDFAAIVTTSMVACSLAYAYGRNTAGGMPTAEILSVAEKDQIIAVPIVNVFKTKDSEDDDASITSDAAIYTLTSFAINSEPEEDRAPEETLVEQIQRLKEERRQLIANQKEEDYAIEEARVEIDEATNIYFRNKNSGGSIAELDAATTKVDTLTALRARKELRLKRIRMDLEALKNRMGERAHE